MPYSALSESPSPGSTLELLRALCHPLCADPVVTDPTSEIPFTGRILVASGWKPGFSTDFDAVLLAERFGARRLLNLSNIAMVYSDDPRTNPDATPLPRLSWKEFRAMVGDEWTPGKNVPFDTVAARKAHEGGLFGDPRRRVDQRQPLGLVE